MTFEEWLAQVDAQLAKINMARKDWDGLYPFKFRTWFERKGTPLDAAIAANRYWWYWWSTQPSTQHLRKLHRRKP